VKLPHSILKLFKSNVSPVPEDPANASGGKWVIALDKSDNISQLWLYCLLALIGEQFQGDYAVGSVLSLGLRNTISIWTNVSHKKCREITQKDLCRFLNISTEKMRFQAHSKEAKSVKCFEIKVTKSMDLTHCRDSLSNHPASGSPGRISPCSSTSFMDDSTAFIDLTSDLSKSTDKGIKSPLKSRQERLIIHPPRCKSLSNPQEVPTAPRMAKSIDSANFMKWRATDMSGKTSLYLPKLHRRKGRRSSWDKLPPSTPRMTSVSQNIPETIKENNEKSQFGTEKEISLDSVGKRPENVPMVMEKQQVNSPGFLGISYLAWLVVFVLVTFVLLGSYITLF